MMSSRLFLLLTASLVGATPPNVLFIAADDLRNDLGCYGETHMITPHIDALAARGRVFRNHYVAVPTCGASRYALMTGLRPTAASDNNDAFNAMPTTLPAEPESWVDLLRRNGWHTASLGKITHEPDGYRWNDSGTYDIGRSRATFPDMRHSWNEIIYDHDKWGAQRYPLFAYADGTGRVRGSTPAYEMGVDEKGESLPDEAYPDGQMALAAMEKLREFADDGTRFCLALGFYKPHLPFNAPKAYWDLYDPATLPPPFPADRPQGALSSTTTNSGEINAYTDRDDRALLRHAYFASISYIDAQIGKVLGELDRLGLADDTIVVLWGDHGWCLDDYGLIGKHKVLERSLESPLIIRPQAGVAPSTFAGLPAHGVVETIDLYPTLAELCGLTPPPSAVGSSLVPLLRNPFAPGKNHAYSRWGSLTTVRTQTHRLIKANSEYDLYDLSSVRYELRDLSSQEPTLVSSLATALNAPGNRPGTTYRNWAKDDPRLANPDGDADLDGTSNRMEYLSGTGALDPSSVPTPTLTFENLESLGFSNHEPVYLFEVALAADDATLWPETSTNLDKWDFNPLEFLDASPVDATRTRLRFRLAAPDAARRFFRTRTSGE